MKHYTVIIKIGNREYRKYPVEFSSEPQVEQRWSVIGGKTLHIAAVDGFTVSLDGVFECDSDSKFVALLEEGFFRSDRF